METDIKAYIDPYIEHYIQEKEISQAILITGNWGCGKTYYWENILSSKIKKHDLIPIYISLNGLKNKKEILNKLSLEVIQSYSKGIINSKTLKATTSVLEIGLNALSGGILNFKKLKLNISLSDFLSMQKLNNLVFCFDDLERYAGKLSDVLGIINDFTEHKYIKVILLANEDKLSNKGTNKFLEIKEKTFAKTLYFKTDKQAILRNIINDKYKNDTELKNFLLSEIPLIAETMEQNGNCNYRVVISLLDDFEYIIKQKIKDIEALSIAKPHLLKFILALGFEIQISAVKKEKIDTLTNDSILMTSLTKGYGAKFKEKYSIDILEPKYIFKSIVKYFTTSILNLDNLNEDISLFKPISLPDYYYLTRIGYWNLSDEEFNEKINKNLLNDIRKGIFDLEYYDEFFILYIYLLTEKLLSININDLYCIFDEGLTALQTKERNTPIEKISYPYSDDYITILNNPSIKPFYDKIKNKIQQTKQILQEKYFKNQSNLFKNLLETNFSKALISISNMPQNPLEEPNIEDFSGKILFFNCSVNEIYNILVNQSNPNINTFTNKIISKYEFPQDFYNSDVKFLKDLSSYIKTQIPVDKQHLKLSERLLLNLSNRINAELKFHP